MVNPRFWGIGRLADWLSLAASLFLHLTTKRQGYSCSHVTSRPTAYLKSLPALLNTNQHFLCRC